jgi:arylsulfatase A-like enzyme
MWEGGMRGAALVWSPHLTNTPRVSTQLAHIQDWLPTLLHAINASTPAASNLDGIDIWDALNDPNKQTYRELLLAIDNKRGINALRIGKWKLFHGK